jgi:hypothetical protein
MPPRAMVFNSHILAQHSVMHAWYRDFPSMGKYYD